MEVCIELAEVFGDGWLFVSRPFMRLCLTLEKLPNIREWQLEQIRDLCVIATDDENCFFMCEDTFLKIHISMKDPQTLIRARIYSDELARRITNGSEPQITIRRNVLPRQGYWTKLQEVYHRSHWTREFYTDQVIKESVIEGKSLIEKLKERRQRGEQCELARSLRTVDGRVTAGGRVDLRTVDPTELVMVNRLGAGGEGTIWKVVWGNCTYAMKSFPLKEGPFSTELKVAKLRPVLHPHIVQVFSRSPVAEEQPFLLMELLDGDLLRCVYENARATNVARRFSRVDRLDLLLQIASAMRILHDNDVVHGDLKLANILLSEFEVSGYVRHFLAKVADFGSAKSIQRIAGDVSEVQSDLSFFIPNGGTTEYASPEVLQWRIDHVVRFSNPRKLDVYSFGVVAYEILTEHRAFNGKLDTRVKINQVSKGEKQLIDSKEWRNLKGGFGYFDEVITLVESCLEFDPEKRPAFSKICEKLTTSKLNLQEWVRT